MMDGFIVFVLIVAVIVLVMAVTNKRRTGSIFGDGTKPGTKIK